MANGAAGGDVLKFTGFDLATAYLTFLGTSAYVSTLQYDLSGDAVHGQVTKLAVQVDASASASGSASATGTAVAGDYLFA
ncbi:MAG: hypothetical protein ACOYOH_19260 [Paracraurococcus sp.]